MSVFVLGYDYIEMTEAQSSPVEKGKLHFLSTDYLPGLMLYREE